MKNLLLSALLSLTALPPALAQSSQTRAVPTFRAINVGTGIELDLTAGPTERVEVSATTPEDRDRIQTTVSNGVLTLRYERAEQGNWWRNHPNQHLHVAVTADRLTALTAGSGSSVEAKGNFAADNFQLDVSSGALLKADMATTALTVRQSSGSTITLQGRAPSLDVRSSSGATFNGRDLLTDRCRAQASSGSSVRVAVKEDLVAQASSGGSVSYSGSPQVTKQTSSGGSVSGH